MGAMSRSGGLQFCYHSYIYACIQGPFTTIYVFWTVRAGVYRLCVGGFVTSTSIDVSQFLNFGLRLVFPGVALPEYLNFSVVIRTLCKHLVVDSPFQRLAADLQLQPDFRPFQPSKTSGLCFLERIVLYS